MENYVSFSPHIKKNTTSNKLYLIIAISLLPTLLAGIIFFGFRSVLILLVSMVGVIGSEIAFNFVKYKKFVFNDYSTVVVGLLIALTMPPNLPILCPLLGAMLSNILVKNCMGGVGKSIVSEVAFAKVITFVAFSVASSCYIEALGGEQTSITMLSRIISEEPVKEGIASLLLGSNVGAIGETAILFILAGGITLCVLKIIDYKVPLVYLVTVLFIGVLCFGVFDAFMLLCAGGAVLCAFYLLTDYSIVPKTLLGKTIYGVGAGLITVLYWKFGKTPDLGAFYAVLIVGLVANAIKGFYRPRIVGEKK